LRGWDELLTPGDCITDWRSLTRRIVTVRGRISDEVVPQVASASQDAGA
jgi:hypothetical protein